MPRPAAHGRAAGKHRGGAQPARKGRAAARPGRQRHGLVPRRVRGPHLHRAHANPVPAFADGQGRDAGRPSAVGRGGAHLGVAERRRRVPDGRPLQLDLPFRPAAAWMPKNAILSAEGAGTMDIGLTQLNVANARSCLNAGTYGTMGVGLGQAIAAAVAEPSRPVIHLSGDSAIGFSGMEMETLVRYNFPVKIVVLNNGGIGPGMPEIPENPMFNMKPNALIYGARYDRMMEAFGGKGFFVEDPKDLKGALDEAMNHRGPALVNVVISQGAARKPQQFRWHS